MVIDRGHVRGWCHSPSSRCSLESGVRVRRRICLIRWEAVFASPSNQSIEPPSLLRSTKPNSRSLVENRVDFPGAAQGRTGLALL